LYRGQLRGVYDDDIRVIDSWRWPTSRAKPKRFGFLTFARITFSNVVYYVIVSYENNRKTRLYKEHYRDVGINLENENRTNTRRKNRSEARETKFRFSRNAFLYSPCTFYYALRLEEEVSRWRYLRIPDRNSYCRVYIYIIVRVSVGIIYTWPLYFPRIALLVRFVTKKFIGDYDPNLEKMYTYQASMESESVNFEILDTAGYVQDVRKGWNDEIRNETNTVPSRLSKSFRNFVVRNPPPPVCVLQKSCNLEMNMRWADVFVLVYSITDKCSFDDCSRLKFLINYNKKKRRLSAKVSIWP